METLLLSQFHGPRDGTGQERTGPRDLEGPVVLTGQYLETLKVLWSWQDRTKRP